MDVFVKTELFVSSENTRDPAGLSTFMSWERLEEVLRRDGQLRPDEKLATVVLGTRGIDFRLQRREDIDVPKL